jgi:endo-1,4-beta-xylanase
LRELAAKHNLLIGAAVNTRPFADPKSHPKFFAVLGSEFNILTPENATKMGSLLKAPGEYDWSMADAMFDFAKKHRMKVRLHTGLWHNQVPRWLNAKKHEFGPGVTAEHLRGVAQAHIQAIGKRYGERMAYWDVVNEAIEPKAKDGLRETIWKKAIGDDYLEHVHRWAHRAAPKAKLVVNDYGVAVKNAKSDRLYELIKDFKQRGVPVHAVGIQMHIMKGRGHSKDRLLANFQRFADLGVEVHVTEMDVGITKYKGNEQEKLEQQAAVYRTVIEALLETKGTVVFQTWGFTDRYSWLRNKKWNGPDDRPLLFDLEYKPKPAYHTIADVLRNTPIKPAK